MKTQIKIAALALVLVTLESQVAKCFAQGSLTPPGAPAPTMKTLAQIEARTPISTAPFTITAPGSYYLTTNLSISSGSAITVSANNVMLDLNGFTLFSTQAPAMGSVGILLYSVTNITIVRGFISGDVTNSDGIYNGNGFSFGIYYSGAYPVNARVSGISVSGCRGSGIYLGFNNSMVESCTVNMVGTYGIVAQCISDSTAQNCGFTAIYANSSANNCYGTCIGSGGYDGIYANVANNCSGYNSGGGFGIVAGNANNCSGTSTTGGDGIAAGIATGCYGESDAGPNDGVYASYLANGCYGYSESGTGVNAFIASVCYGSVNSGTALSTLHNVNSFSF